MSPALAEADSAGRWLLVAETDRNDPRLVRPRAGPDSAWPRSGATTCTTPCTLQSPASAGYYGDFGRDDRRSPLARGPPHGTWSVRHRSRRPRPSVDPWATRRPAPARRAVQNHDQVGNRAAGTGCPPEGLVRPAAARPPWCSPPFVALLFQGEEWAATTPFPYFATTGDPGAAVRRGRAGAGVRRVSAGPRTRSRTRRTLRRSTPAVLRWGEVAAAPHREVLDWYRSLIALRARHESLAPVLLPARHEVRVRDHVVAVRAGR